MLVSLTIQNIVLIDQLSLAFEAGLTTFTGETGAGKSIVLDSLDLVLGGRGSATFIRAGKDKATIIAEFDINQNAACQAVLKEYDIESEETLRLKRSLNRDGKSKAFINDQPVGVALLRQVGDTLLEISGQFEHHLLMDTKNHRTMLDAYGNHKKALANVVSTYQDWQDLQRQCTDIETRLAETKAQEEYLRFAVTEFENLNPEIGEAETLAERRHLLMNTEKISEELNTALNILDHDQGANSQLNTALAAVERVQEGMTDKLTPLLGSLGTATAETQEAIATLQSILSETEDDPKDLEQIDERLFALKDLARKHQTEPDNLPVVWHRLKDDLTNLSEGEGNLDELRRQAVNARENYIMACQQLTTLRTKTAQKMDAAIMAELAPLKLESAEFLTEITPLEETSWGGNGQDKIFFTARTNKGTSFGPIPKIASGGELSRFLLALKVVLSETAQIPVLVFDEVDSGVGGPTADAVGERLSRLSKDVQVLVVTHSPQVGARGNHHYLVAKQETGNNTTTSVTQLTGESRREEIARMLSGASITDQARQAADSLMKAG